MAKELTKLTLTTATKKVSDPYGDRIAKFMLEALIECDWRLTAAGKLVGSNRDTMRRWRDRFESEGVKVKRYRGTDWRKRLGGNTNPI